MAPACFTWRRSLSVGLSFVYAKRYVTGLAIAPAALTTYQMGFGLATLAVVTDYHGLGDIRHDARASLGLVLGLGLAGTGVAYILYYLIVEHRGAVAASTATYIPPVVALFIGWFLVGEPIGWWDVIGMCVILTGVVLLGRQPAVANTQLPPE